MLIANPIYDVFFKYLMEDIESAKTIISVILEKEIISLTAMPQEQTVYSGKYGLSVVRLDFKAIILTENGRHEKILVEMQKAKNTADVYRFRRYLGENYIKTDKIDGQDMNLPITCIYFIGYEVPIENAVIHNRLLFRDIVSGEEVKQNMELLELLSHESYFVFIDNLPKSKKENHIFAVLDIFDQQFISDENKKWILEKDNLTSISNDKLKQLMMRLHEATLEAELIEKAKLEEEFNRDIELMISKFENEAIEERKLKEEALKLKEEEKKLKEHALKEIEALKLLLNQKK
jgi:hypothetical protein